MFPALAATASCHFGRCHSPPRRCEARSPNARDTPATTPSRRPLEEDAMTQTEVPHDSLNAEQVGYKQTLGRRHVQMIAIGGAIGPGLFLGSASRLHSTGPALLFSYAFVGVIAYFLMRALGELVLHRPPSGAFVSYMREFYGEKWAFITGWMYW